MSAARRILLTLPAVLGLPVAQAALVRPGATPAADIGFVLMALASFAVTVLGAWLLATALLAGIDGAPWRPGPRALVRTLAVAAIVGACAVVHPLLALPALVLAALLLPALAAGEGVRAGLRGFRRHPGRSALLAVATLALCLLGWLTALITGLFVTGALGALLCWFGFALAGAIALAGSTALLRRP
ncbi:hypothetical protein HQQ81_14985 [Microbacteriaceae bacterium VKM Ac-2854]|nr:hypothetical protein [Microbacteriaceae bacterium VKM Ac-2854]